MLSNNSRIHIFLKCNGTFLRIDHTIGNKRNLSKFKKTKIIPTVFPDHGMKLDINNRKARKSTNMWKLHNTLLNNQWIKQDQRRNKNLS